MNGQNLEKGLAYELAKAQQKIQELESSNSDLKQIGKVVLETTLEPMIIVDKFGKCIDINAIASSLLGLKKEELLSALIKELYISYAENKSIPDPSGNLHIFLVDKTKDPIETPYTIKNKINDNLTLYILDDPIKSSLSLRNDFSRNKPEKINISIDNSELDELIPTMFTNLGRWAYHLIEDELFWSEETCKIFGVSEAEFDGGIKTFYSRIHPADLELVKQAWQETIKERGSHKIEYRIIQPTSDIKWVYEKCSIVFDIKNNPVRLIGYYQDITDRKTNEEKIKQQAKLLDIVQDAIIVCDLSGRIIFWNKTASKMYGWESEKVLGMNLSKLLSQNSMIDEQQWIDGYNKVIEQGEWTSQQKHFNRTGQQLLVETRWVLMSNNNSKSILIVNTDITEKRKLELDFLRAQRIESIGALASGIAHDLNNMLSPILLSVQILKRKSSDPIIQKMLLTLESTAQRGADLVKQVLSFSRGLEGRTFSTDVKQVISEIEKLVKEIFPKSIELTINVDKDLWPIFGDPTQIHQVLLNLCLNARDAMPKGGMINIRASNTTIDSHYAQMQAGCNPGRYIVIAVEDTGNGISPDNLNKIFEPFFTTKDIEKGTGLGLSTVMSIVKTHGGFINVHSELNKGTRFKIHFPVADKSTKKMDINEIELDSPLGDGETILVIDDEAAIREITKSTLTAYNYNPITATDGIEGLTLYIQNKEAIKLVVMDVMMPVMDGISTIKALQRINPDVKIISITGLATSSRENELINLGVKKILAKPYSAGTLLKAIRENIK